MRRLMQALPHFLSNALFMAYRSRGIYCQDGLITVHNSDFRQSEIFDEAYRLAKQTGSFENWEASWRVYICCWFAKMADRLSGDFVECGVNRGGASRAIMHYIGFENSRKTYWLLDTFEGLDDKQINQEERKRGIQRMAYKDCYNDVVETFSKFTNVRIVKGAVPGTLQHVTSEKLCYLSIDMNNAAPEIAAATHFWDRMVSGGVIVLDDYGWPKHREQRAAFNSFAQQRGLEVLSLPTGQGLLLKP